MRVLFLTRYPIEGASSRYRAYQYIPHLTQLGWTCHVSSFMDRRLYELTFTNGNTAEKLWRAGCSVLRRLVQLSRARSYDVIVLQRELLPFGPPVLEKNLSKLSTPVVFDYDDALYISKPSCYNPLATRLRNSNKTMQVFKLADCVLAGNTHLMRVAAKHAKRAITFETAEDTDRIAKRPPHTSDGPFVIGWLGSKTTGKYLEIIRTPLMEVCRAAPQTVVRVVGNEDFKGNIPIEHLPWSLDTEIDALHTFDVGVMPLPDEPWSLGKSGGKARTYMAAGVVPVCSALGYNNELIEHARTGFLVRDPREWTDTLIKLANSPKLRQHIADAARRYVEQHFSLARQAKRLHVILHHVVEQTDVH